jgi:hypothetical protein
MAGHQMKRAAKGGAAAMTPWSAALKIRSGGLHTPIAYDVASDLSTLFGTIDAEPLRQRLLLECCDIEGIDVLQQFDEGRGAIVGVGLALARIGGRRIAHGAGGG